MNNQVVITGQVSKSAKFNQSPAGVVLGQFSLEHKSIQQEGDFNRQAYVRIQVFTCGQDQKQLVENFVVGDEVTVSGFLNRHENKNGLAVIALHAQHIERLN